jgi:hypothetical protein
LADLSKLKNPIYPNDKIIAWSVSDMQFMFKISEEQKQQLSELDQRSYDFNPTKNDHD